MKSNWNHRRLSETGKLHSLRRVPPSGFKGGYKPRKVTGYHKLMPKSERVALAMRLQREAVT